MIVCTCDESSTCDNGGTDDYLCYIIEVWSTAANPYCNGAILFLWWIAILQYCHARLRTCVHWICISLMNLIGVFGCFDWTFLICGKIYYWHVIDLEILYRFLKLFIKFVYFCETTIKNLKLKKKNNQNQFNSIHFQE